MNPVPCLRFRGGFTGWAISRYGVALALCFALGGCGIHLQGSRSSLPDGLQRVAIRYHSSYDVVPAPLLDDVKDVLKRNGVQLVSSADRATAVLTLHPPQASRHVLTVNTRGSTVAYTLKEAISYRLQLQPSGHEISQSLSTTEDHTYLGSLAIAKQEEAERLRDAM